MTDKKRLEFSKWVVIAAFALFIIMFFFVLIFTWISRDSSPLGYLIPAVAAPFGFIVTWYMEKSKKENVAKICSHSQEWEGEREHG